MKVSVIIPVYNVEPYISECLHSVMAQKFTDFECIIVDDCGHDKSISIAEKIVSEYSGPITFRIIHREKNGGLSAARNSGICEARGEYLYFLDSDDKIFPHTLESLVALTTKYPGVDMVCGKCITEEGTPGGNPLNYETAPEYYADERIVKCVLLEKKFGITAWNRLLRSEIIRTKRLRFLEGIIHEDEKWMFDLQKHLRTLAIVNDFTYWYRFTPGSIMRATDMTRSLLSCIRIIRECYSEIENEEELKFLIYIISYQILNRRRKKAHNKKKVKEALSLLEKTLKNEQRNRNNKVLLNELRILRMPIWVTDNMIFNKLYYEYHKLIKLV